MLQKKNRTRRERFLDFVDTIYVDGRNDLTIVMTKMSETYARSGSSLRDCCSWRNWKIFCPVQIIESGQQIAKGYLLSD